MSESTYKQFEELVGLVALGKYPILPRPDWGQDSAYLAFTFDRLVEKNHKLGETLEMCLEHLDLLMEAMQGDTKFVCGICGAIEEEDHKDDCPLIASAERLRLAAEELKT